MDAHEIRNTFNSLRLTISAADEGTRAMLPCIAGRLQLCGAGGQYDGTPEALSALKRELQNWDITKKVWKSPR